ncbi:MAG TPA: 4Fe-4S binding protein [Rectinemataceae bacterium]|nr:4Fe-4S binding protein [Rectinemataceae bacterium]
MQKLKQRLLVNILSLLFVLTVAAGGFFFREFGLALAALMVTAIVLAVSSPKPRSFCSAVCPRGRALGFALRPISLGLSLPRFLSSRAFRRFLCGTTMFLVFMSLFQVAPGVSVAEWAGMVFWTLCLVTLSLGLILGIVFRPRAWCAICPLGTLQDTIREARQRSAS